MYIQTNSWTICWNWLSHLNDIELMAAETEMNRLIIALTAVVNQQNHSITKKKHTKEIKKEAIMILLQQTNHYMHNTI